jgi:hypothetical protein
MRNAFSIGLALALILPALSKDNDPPPNPQIQRGHDIFVKSGKGTACATCHELGGEGTAVGPDLKMMGSQGTPHVIIMTMRMTMTNNVQSFKTTHGGTFPGMLKEKGKDETEVWDLSQTPPLLRKLPNSEIVSVDRDQTWKHPPASVDYTPQELSDLISFLRWASTGTAQEVKAADCDMQ